MPTTDELLAQLVALQREQLKMTRFAAFAQLKTVLQETLRADQEKLIFENSTGASTRDVGEAVGAHKDTVLRLWAKWAPLGIVTEMDGQPGRYQRICSLREVGIEPPERPTEAKATPKQPPVAPKGKKPTVEVVAPQET